MPELVGITGIKKGRVNCQIVRTVTELFRVLKPKLAATAAGDNGSISVWISDGGRYYVSFHRRMMELSSWSYAHKKDVRKWLKEWWPQMGDRERMAQAS